jgi:hypothetical protein
MEATLLKGRFSPPHETEQVDNLQNNIALFFIMRKKTTTFLVINVLERNLLDRFMD